jgi:DNA-binding response OmpR family regulator
VAADGSGLVIDARSGDVLVNGRRVETLTALEYSLLKLLYDSPGRLCSKDEIIRHVWGDEFLGEVDASRVEKLVSRLRRKIEAVPGRPQYIRTVRGRGYRFVP